MNCDISYIIRDMTLNSEGLWRNLRQQKRIESDEGRGQYPFGEGNHEGFSEEGTCEQRPEGGGQVSPLNVSDREEHSRQREQYVQRHEK